MQKALSFLIIIGLVVWGFLMYEKSHPTFSLPHMSVNAPEQEARCATFGTDVEGERTLSYGDRIKEIMNGCW